MKKNILGLLVPVVILGVGLAAYILSDRYVNEDAGREKPDLAEGLESAVYKLSLPEKDNQLKGIEDRLKAIQSQIKNDNSQFETKIQSLELSIRTVVNQAVLTRQDLVYLQDEVKKITHPVSPQIVIPKQMPKEPVKQKQIQKRRVSAEALPFNIQNIDYWNSKSGIQVISDNQTVLLTIKDRLKGWQVRSIDVEAQRATFEKAEKIATVSMGDRP